MTNNATLYKIDLNRMTFAELRRHAQGPAAAALYWLLAKFRLLKSPMPIVYQARDFAQTRVDLDVLSYEAMAALRPYLEGFERLGYAPVHYVRLDERVDPTLADSAGCYLLHASGESFALVAYAQKWRPPEYRAADTHTVTWLGAVLKSGLKIAVTDMPAYLDFPSPTHVTVVRGATPAEMQAALRAGIDARSANDPVAVVDGPARLAAEIERDERRATEARVARGLYVPLAEAELAAAQARVASARGRASS